MTRIHRSLLRRAHKINASRTADFADEYLCGCSLYRNELKGIPGLKQAEQIKQKVKEIDKLEYEVAKLEDKIKRIKEKRNLIAARLEESISQNFEVLEEYLEPHELKDFK